MTGWRKSLALLVAVIGIVQGLDMLAESAPMPKPAERFIGYYNALGENSEASFLDRLLFSYVMARNRP